MKNKKADIIESFYINARSFIEISGADINSIPLEEIYEDLKNLRSDYKKSIDVRMIKSEWFSKNGDYRAYYAFLRVYHALIQYYRYYAPYNMKDVELESALKDWYVVTQNKPNIFSKIFQRIK